MINQEISQLLAEIADALEFKDENRFRVLAYRRGAEALADLDEDLTVLLSEKRLTDVVGIGKGLALDIAEYLAQHRMTAHERAMEGIPPRLLGLLKLSGLGPKRLARLHFELGVSDLWTLKDAIDSGRLAALSGFGAKTAENLSRSVERLAVTQERIPMAEALQLTRSVLEDLGSRLPLAGAMFAGSFRRGRETCGDLDLLVPSNEGAKVVQAFTQMSGVERVLAAGDTRGSVHIGGRQVDLRVVPPESFGAALCYFTGSKDHNVRLREIAKKRGLKINEYGVFRDDVNLGGLTEEDVYATIDLPWIPPEIREDRGEIEAAREGRVPDLVRREDVVGDFHVHTSSGDGGADVMAMTQKAAELGYRVIAITDHASSNVYPKGLTVEGWRAQRKEIEAARKDLPTVQVLHGMEVDIGLDGTIDLPAEIRDEVEWVAAGIHAGFEDRVTERILVAMENPDVDLIVHPTGRIVHKREGYAGLELERLFEKAKATNTALELNASPDRLDLPAEVARRAVDHGVRLVFGSDARSPDEMENMEVGIRTARRGWITRAEGRTKWPVRRKAAGRGM
ncbi:MAG TPA: DNA polymerase/3'-5' exonuclease PolX [Dongiaceae bacterium]|nr:DNA polymerase/3'-5' exonuclease PolX [Dongiaceae bacterium]